MGAKSSKLGQPAPVVVSADTTSQPKIEYVIPEYDVDVLPPQAPPVMIHKQIKMEEKNYDVPTYISSLENDQERLDPTKRFLAKYIIAAKKRESNTDPDKLPNLNGECRLAVLKIKDRVERGKEYSNNHCTEPDNFYIFGMRPKPTTENYICDIILDIANNIRNIELEIENNPQTTVREINDILLEAFLKFILNTKKRNEIIGKNSLPNIDTDDAEANRILEIIFNITGIRIDIKYMRDWYINHGHLVKNQVVVGGKKSKSVRRRKRATRIRPRNRRKSSIIRHDLRRGSHKRTVRRLQ